MPVNHRDGSHRKPRPAFGCGQSSSTVATVADKLAP